MKSGIKLYFVLSHSIFFENAPLIRHFVPPSPQGEGMIGAISNSSINWNLNIP